MENYRKNTFDYVGIVSSGICLIHCMLMPIILLFKWEIQLESLGFAHHPSWDYLFIGLGLIAVWMSSHKHTPKGIRIGLWVAYLVFVWALLYEDQVWFAQYLGWIASLGLITTHYFNIKFCKKCQTENYQ